VVVTDDLSRIAAAMPDYDVERELGRGGMGVVFLGRHRRLDRGVAIKELPTHFAAEPAVQERFSTEARTLAGLSHPHIVPIFDYVEREGLCLIVMEALPGGTVWDRFTTTGLTPPTACAVVMACCAALQHAHSKGVLHLDVKPDNLMFDAESAVKVTDFGIARVISGDRTLGTVGGQVLGTPAYMSPEQARGDDLTTASDVYAAGVMLYELLSGQLPWQGAETAAELLSQRLREDPTPIRTLAPHVPEPLAEVIMTALARDASQRFDRAEDFGVAIGEACAEAWGPEWLDHAGVALVGSERISRAARTTGGRTAAAVAAAATASAPKPTAEVTPDPAASGARGAVAAPDGAAPRAGATVVTGPAEGAVPGAAETSAGGAPAAPATARETVVPGSAPAGDQPAARETIGPVSTPDGGAPRARETVVPGTPTGGDSPVGRGTVVPGTPPADHAPAARETVVPGATPSGGAPPGRETVVPGGPDAGVATDPAAAGPAAGGDGAVPAPPQFQVVRRDADERIEPADLFDLELADLIGVEDVLDPPRPPWPALLVTGLLYAAVVLVALIGIGTVERDSGLTAGQVEVAGVDVIDGGRIEVDLSENVPVRVVDPALAGQVDLVELELSYLGVPVSTATALVRGGEALVDPGIAQRTVGGHATARVTLQSGDRVVAEHDVGIDATQTWYLTAPFVLGVVLLLLAFANVESSLKPLRSGRTRRLSYLGAAFSSALGALGVVALSAAIGSAEPTVAGTVVVAVLGAAAGAAAARARIGVARRRRVRRAVRRAERALGVTAPTH
jgi:hypothetical protein